MLGAAVSKLVGAVGIETTYHWHFNDLRSRARTEKEGLGSPWNPYCRLFSHDAANNSAICFAYCFRYCLRVDVHGRSNVRMPQQCLLNFHIDFVLTQQARVRVSKRMPSNTPDAGCYAGGNQMILTNLTRPIRIPCLRVGEDPFRIDGLRSLSVLPKNAREVSIHGKRFCGTFCLCVFHITFHPGPSD
jgi:hypothetical protein